MSKRAVIVVDLQNDYLPSGKFALAGVEQAVANAAKVIAHARETGDDVIHVRHEFTDPAAPFFNPGTPGVEIIDAVRPAEGEQVVTKNFPNSFRETDLRERLENGGVTDVTVVGAMSHMCIDATARAAADLGFNVTVVHDACATRDLEFGGATVPAGQVHAAEMAALGFAYATLTTAEDYAAG